jgi:hypothetical protein
LIRNQRSGFQIIGDLCGKNVGHGKAGTSAPMRMAQMNN